MDLRLTEDNEKKKNNKRSLIISDENSDRKRRKQEHVILVEEINYGDGMAWFRGCLIGKGCFGSVFMANLKKPKSRYSSYPPIMAVKSAEVSVSSSIQKEREVLNNIRGCRNVIRCYGEEITTGENGQMVYNLLLEYGSGGTLADVIKNSGEIGLPESDAKRHTRSILRGLSHIHRCGFVHCDLKPENILLFGNSGGFMAKIGDFGLAKRAKQSRKSKLLPYRRGTPMYFSPEVVIDGVQEPPSDIWAIGCILLEMLTGKPPWDSRPETEIDEIVSRIGETNEIPPIPGSISREGRSFLKGCFSRKAMYRWTAEMLLAHPFLEGIGDDEDDVDKVEDSEVLDINAISSSMMLESEDDDEISFSSFSDGYEDELYFFSEEDVEGMENEISSCFSLEESLQAEKSGIAPLNELRQYPLSFTISGV